MNKNECKKYIKKAFNSIEAQNKPRTIHNLEKLMKYKINRETELYIAYSKIALYTLLNSGTDVNLENLFKELEVIPKIYNEIDAIKAAEKLS